MLRDELKARTAAAHRRAEQAMGGVGAVSGAPARYAQFLCCMAALHARWRGVQDAGAALAGIDPMGGRIAAALEDDLRRLGADDARAPADPRRRAPEQRPAEGADAEAWGVSYVFEGSAMGAMVLLKAARRAGDRPTAYLSLLAESARTRWPLFVAGLCAAQAPEQAVIDAALRAFESVETTARQTEPNALAS